MLKLKLNTMIYIVVYRNTVTPKPLYNVGNL